MPLFLVEGTFIDESKAASQTSEDVHLEVQKFFRNVDAVDGEDAIQCVRNAWDNGLITDLEPDFRLITVTAHETLQA